MSSVPAEQNLVSVIIPVYNRLSWIEEALQSVREQSWPHWEVILCDDGSDEQAASVLDQLADSDRIRVLHLPHRGPGPAREAGRQAACGEFIQYLDSDDRLHPEKFEKQVAALRAQPDCGIAYGRTRLIDENGSVLEESYKRIREKDFLFPDLLVDRWWCTHTPLYRRELCDRIGPWCDLRYSQDWEYDARAGALKTKVVFVDQTVSDHRCHYSAVRQTGQGRWLTPPDQIRFFQSLYACSKDAAVPANAPEMNHFVRWVFAAARTAGRMGDSGSAGKLLSLAVRAGEGSSAGPRIYGVVSRLLGWRIPDLFVEGTRQILRRNAGPFTLRQSWMNDND